METTTQPTAPSLSLRERMKMEIHALQQQHDQLATQHAMSQKQTEALGNALQRTKGAISALEALVGPDGPPAPTAT
jgi:hypothetical protein